jgi:hypothetical protein
VGSNFYFQNELLSDEVFFNTYSGILEVDRIDDIVATMKSYQLIAYIFIPIILLLKVLYNTFCITTGTLISDHDIFSFSGNFNISLKAEIVFSLLQVFKIVWFAFFKEVNTVADISLIPFSMLDFIGFDKAPKWGVYMLQTLNIWELFFCMFGSLLFATYYNISVGKAMRYFCIPYMVGVSILVVLTAYFTIQFS